MRIPIASLGIVLFFMTACQDAKIASLEKQNKELKAEIEKSHATADYDLQAKCSKDAKAFFNENLAAAKDAQLFTFRNHYNKPLNKCFIIVEYHYSIGQKPSWANSITLWDVYENLKYAKFAETHMIYFKPTPHTEDNVVTCESSDKKCKSGDEFNEIVSSYLND
jgi:hypothetical protein